MPKKPFKPDYRVAKLSLIGVAGFFIGCIILFWSDLITPRNKGSIFHEISYDPREIIDPMLRQYNKLLIDSTLPIHEFQLKEIETKINNNKQTNLLDKNILLKEKDRIGLLIKKDTEAIKALQPYIKLYKDLPYSDTFNFNRLNKLLYFRLSPKKLDTLETEYRNKDTGEFASFPIYCAFKGIEVKVVDSIATIYTFATDKPSSDVEFIGKYPIIGVWLLLILVFCSLCFMIVPLAVNLRNKSDKLLADTMQIKLSRKTYWIILVITNLIFLFTMMLWWTTFFDDPVVKDIFFLKHMRARLEYVISIGVIAGNFCMAGFIHIASILSCLAGPLTDLRKSLRKCTVLLQQEKDRAVPELMNAAIAKAAETLSSLQEEEADKKEAFNKFSSYFQSYFIMAAVILSFTVLCTGTLFQGIQSLDFVKMLASNWGYSPARTDYVYFYGLLFTIILLLVYIPAKVKFTEVDVWSNDTTSTQKNKWYDFIKIPFTSKELFVATSPLLVSLVQSLFETLFK